MAHEATPSREFDPGGRLWLWLAVAISPVPLTFLGVIALVAAVGPPLPTGVVLAIYAVASVLVVAILIHWLSPAARTGVAPLRVPGIEEVGAAVAVALVAIFGIDPVADAVADALGLGTSGGATSVETTLGAIVLAVSAIAVAPITEEVLYRGLALAAIRARYGTATAVVGSSLLFGGIHVIIGGPATVVFAFIFGLALAAVRVRYESLAGVGLAHALNNAVGVGIALGFLPAFVPG